MERQFCLWLLTTMLFFCSFITGCQKETPALKKQASTEQATTVKSQQKPIVEEVEDLPADTVLVEEEPEPLEKVNKNDKETLKILYLHAWEAAFSPAVVEGQKCGGLRHLAALSKKLGKQQQYTTLCSAGNLFQGNDNDKPVVEALRHLSLSAGALGNLDLNNGVENLLEKIANAHFKILSANVYQKQQRLLPAYAIETFGPFKVAFIGLTAQETAVQLPPHVSKGLLFKNPASELRGILREIEGKANVFVILSNLGHQQDIQIARQYQQLHLIIGSYDRGLSPRAQDVGQVKIVRVAKNLGMELGELLLSLDKKGGIVLSAPQYYDIGPESKHCQGLTVAPEIDELVSTWEKQERIQREVLSTSEVLLVGNTEAIRSRETNLGNLLADIMLARYPDAQIAFINSGAIRSSIAKGEITRNKIAQVLPYENKLVTITLRGEVLKEVLENAVAHYETKKGAFLQVAGMSFAFSPSAPPYSRVGNITVGQQPIDPGKEYKVVTLDYIASGGDDYLMLRDQQNQAYPHTIQQVVIEYLQKQSSVHPEISGRIKIK